MKFEIDRLAMLEAAKKAARVAPTSSHVDVLNGVLVESNDDTAEVFMTATNHEVSIQQKVIASVSESGSMLVNARLLVNMLSLLPGEFVTFSAVRPEVLTVAGGKCVYEINCLSAQHYPKPVMPFPEETVQISGICSLARRTVFAVSKDENKPSLQCVSVKFRNNAVHASACDGIKMILTKDTVSSPDERAFLLPGRSLQILASISADKDVFDVGDMGQEVAFVRNDMLFIIRKLPGEYIDTAAIIKGITPAFSTVTDVGKIREALNIVAVGAENEPMNLLLSRDQIIIQRNSEYSEARTSIAAKVSKDTPSDGFYYEINSLMKLIQVIEGRIKIEIDAKGFILIKTKNEVYLQLPRRMPVNKVKNTSKNKEAA